MIILLALPVAYIFLGVFFYVRNVKMVEEIVHEVCDKDVQPRGVVFRASVAFVAAILFVLTWPWTLAEEEEEDK